MAELKQRISALAASGKLRRLRPDGHDGLICGIHHHWLNTCAKCGSTFCPECNVNPDHPSKDKDICDRCRELKPLMFEPEPKPPKKRRVKAAVKVSYSEPPADIVPKTIQPMWQGEYDDSDWVDAQS
jgi:hypothetical protein